MGASLRDKKSLRYATVDLIFSFLGLEPDGSLSELYAFQALYEQEAGS